MFANLPDTFHLFPLKAQSLYQYHNQGAQLASTTAEAGTLLCFSPEDLLFIAIDLQNFNSGVSTTNCIEHVWEFAQKVSRQYQTPSQHIRLLEIDSMGFIDEYVGHMGKSAWKAFGVGLEPLVPPRTVESLSALIHDRFEPFLRFINTVLHDFGLVMVAAKPPQNYPSVDGHVFSLQRTLRLSR